MKKQIFPVLAAAAALAAALVLVFVPRGGSAETPEQPAAAPAPAAGFVEQNESGDVVIRNSTLSGDEISFLKLSDDSRIELIAVQGSDGQAYAALGTCQSCMGSPGAFYTQNGDMLQCNNCGLTFPLSVIGTSGAGCHPIMIDEKAVQRDGEDLVIDVAALTPYEPLFATVAEH